MQSVIHYFLHFGFILIIARIFFRDRWRRAYLILLATMLVDLDHLLADPVFQPDKISIAYHYLHTYPAIGGYVLMLFMPSPFNIIGTGLLFHMFTDLLDGMFMFTGNEGLYSEVPAYGLLKFLSSLLGLNK